jgi:hypothetical protein
MVAAQARLPMDLKVCPALQHKLKITTTTTAAMGKEPVTVNALIPEADANLLADTARRVRSSLVHTQQPGCPLRVTITSTVLHVTSCTQVCRC